MKIKNRQQMLAIAAIAAVALFVGDKIVFTPLARLWKSRAEQIVQLRKQIADGAMLVQRERLIRNRWEQMQTNTLPKNSSLAEQQVFKAIDSWAQDSRVSITAIAPQWKHDADDYTTLDCRVEASGDLATVSRFLYEIEKDPLALKLESVEVSSRDGEGQQIALGLQLSGLVLNLPTQ